MIIFAACSNDIDLIHYSEPIPIVYGIIYPNDSIHNIRLTKSFIIDSSPWQAAKQAELQYYDDVTMFLELRSEEGAVLERAEFSPVQQENKQDGLFFQEPNIMYQTSGLNYLTSDRWLKSYYYLTIHISETNQTLFAKTLIPPKPSLKTDIGGNDVLDLFSSSPRYIKVSSNPFYASEVSIIVNYSDQINGTWESNQISYKRQNSPSFGPDDLFFFDASWFYPFMRYRIPNNPNVSHRRFESITLRSQLIDPAYYNYYSSLHYRSDLYENMLSNIEGGKGLFAAYNRAEKIGIELNDQSLDSLAFGSVTKHLKFRRW